jgi:hypothetical protein
LTRANRLSAGGQHAQAAGIFEQLAHRVEQQGMPIRSAELALQASRAHFAAGAIEAALAWARRGIHALIHCGRVGRIPRLLAAATTALRSKGHDAEADELEQEINQALAEAGSSLDEARKQAGAAPEKHGSLPAQCGGCGAPLVPDDVEWHDAQTAECPYCGTIAKAT